MAEAGPTVLVHVRVPGAIERVRGVPRPGVEPQPVEPGDRPSLERHLDLQPAGRRQPDLDRLDRRRLRIDEHAADLEPRDLDARGPLRDGFAAMLAPIPNLTRLRVLERCHARAIGRDAVAVAGLLFAIGVAAVERHRHIDRVATRSVEDVHSHGQVFVQQQAIALGRGRLVGLDRHGAVACSFPREHIRPTLDAKTQLAVVIAAAVPTELREHRLLVAIEATSLAGWQLGHEFMLQRAAPHRIRASDRRLGLAIQHEDFDRHGVVGNRRPGNGGSFDLDPRAIHGRGIGRHSDDRRLGWRRRYLLRSM